MRLFQWSFTSLKIFAVPILKLRDRSNEFPSRCFWIATCLRMWNDFVMFCIVIFPPLRFTARLLWLPNLFLSLKEVLSTVQKSSTFCKGHLKQERNIRMGFFVCVCVCVCAVSREVWATLATHCRLPDTHVCCENWMSRPGRLVLFLLPVRPSLQEGALRRIQGPLTTFLLHSGISGSERTAASSHTHTHTHTHTHINTHARTRQDLHHLTQGYRSSRWMNEWMGVWMNLNYCTLTLQSVSRPALFNVENSLFLPAITTTSCNHSAWCAWTIDGGLFILRKLSQPLLPTCLPFLFNSS